MLKVALKYVPVTTLIVVFFFGCGGLYLIGYWTTFDIDVSNLISLTDIPKSFILPCTVTHAFFLSTLFIVPLVMHKKATLKIKYSPEVYARKRNRGLTFVTSAIFLYPLLFTLFLTIFSRNSYFWIIAGAVLAYLFFLWTAYMRTLMILIPKVYLRVYIVFIVVFTPIMSFSVGKAKSVDIFNNHNIKYMAIIKKNNAIDMQAQKNNISVKFLGFLGDKLIVSSLDNNKVYFMNQDAVDGIELETKEKSKKILRFY